MFLAAFKNGDEGNLKVQCGSAICNTMVVLFKRLYFMLSENNLPSYSVNVQPDAVIAVTAQRHISLYILLNYICFPLTVSLS